jgi:hypothetical protein
MGKPRSREPADALPREAATPSREDSASNKKRVRPARRSIVDLTESACRAAEDGAPPAAVAAPSQPLITAGKAIASDAVDGGSNVSPPSWPGLSRLRGRSPFGVAKARPSTSSPMAQPQDAEARHEAGHDEAAEAVDRANRSEPGEKQKLADTSVSCKFDASDSSADMAVKIAKACQAETLDDIKAGFNAALDYAAEFLRRGAASEIAGDHSSENSDAERRNALTAQYRAEAARLMTANMATTMNFARRLLGANSSAEWVELTSTHARLQCELMLQQAQALRSLARGITESDGDPAASRGATSQK